MMRRILIALLLAVALPALAGSGDYVRAGLHPLKLDGSRVNWSPDGQWIAYDKLEADGFFDVHRMHPDGTGDECLTCDQPALPNRNQGMPSYSSDGHYLAFEAELASHAGQAGSLQTTPGAGVYNDLWVLDLQTGQFYRLTNVNPGTQPGGSLHPRFSQDGKRLLWGDLVGRAQGAPFGVWRIAVADFVTSPSPHLENTMTFQPGEEKYWYEMNGWSLDDRKILITAATLEGMSVYAMDEYWFDLETQALQRLTQTSGLNGEPAEWDEVGHMSPKGDAIVWVSSNGYGTDPGPNLRTDLWIMDTDGSNKRRITFFNEPGGDGYDGEQAITSDNSWSPDGRHVVLYMQFPQRQPRREIWMLDWSEPLAADFSFDPVSPTDATPVTFTATVAGGTAPYAYSWDFCGTSATGESATETLAPGSCTVTLTVTDASGSVATSSKTVAVGYSIAISSVRWLSNPGRLKVSGSGFDSGCRVEINGVPAPSTLHKNEHLLIAGGSGLKPMVPKGVSVQVTIVDPDGSASAPFTFTRCPRRFTGKEACDG